jgi:hypothetical protein
MKTVRMLTIVGVGLILTVQALGTTYYVDPCGSDDANGLSWDTALATIQTGIEVAGDGDIVEVNEGTYVENVASDGNSITLVSVGVNDFNSFGSTIIDGNEAGPTITFASGEDSNTLLIGFTITNGTEGISCINSSSLVISKCVIRDNSWRGIYCSSSAPAVKDCWIYKNDMGIEFSSASSAATVRNNTVVNNRRSGVYVGSGTAPAISSCIIWDCNDDLYGCSATYSCVEDGNAGTGNISSYPYFAGYEVNDFHLTRNSPCMNRGEPNFDTDGEVDIDGDSRVINNRLDMGADEFNTVSANLVQNPGFEGNDVNGVPVDWFDYPPSTEKMIDANEKHLGSFSWKFVSNDANLFSGGYSEKIAVTLNAVYKLSGWIKCETGDEVICLGWQLLDADGNDIADINSFVLYYETVPTEWTEFVGYYPMRNSNASYVKVYLHGPYKTTGTVWWDDLSLTEVGPEFLPTYGCDNEPNVVETIDFGGGDGSNEHWVPDINKHDANVISDPYAEPNDDNITYREIEGNKTLTMRFPAFNVDPNYDPNAPDDLNGLPLTAMLLEIMYKDTTAGTGIKVAAAKRYVNFDPNYGIVPLTTPHFIGHLGESQDNQWKYFQYAFQKTGYGLLRAMSGIFQIQIVNGTSQPLPIDYVSLRKLTDADYMALSSKQRARRNFHPVDLPVDVPSPPVSYSDPNITVFSRDIMRPVYQDTKPGPNEFDANIVGFSVWGQTEPVSFSVYSENGVNDLTVTVSNLIHSEDSNHIIDGNEIGIYHVVYDETRLAWYAPTGYALLGDHLEELGVLSVDANTSERVWLKIQVPDVNEGLASGLYEGNMYVKKNGSTEKTVPVKFSVYDIVLDLAEHINPVSQDPFSQVYSSDLKKVLNAYRETGFDPYISDSPVDKHRIEVVKDTNQPYNVDFNTVSFEAALDRMVDEGFAKDGAILNFAKLRDLNGIYGIAFGSGYNDEDPNLYYKLSDPNFVGAYSLLIEKYMEIGAARGVSFVFKVIDEPAEHPYKRILANRLYTIIKDPNGANGATTVTYWLNCDDNDTNAGSYNVPGGKVPPLTDLVDYKVWGLWPEAYGYEKHDEPNYFGNFGYYTTIHSHLRNPVYNRFLHGLFAFATDASVVQAYAMGDYVCDPYNDFDAAADSIYPKTQPDYLYAYPTWSGELLHTIGGLEAIREGIKDARYIATLKNLIGGDPNKPGSIAAQDYLNQVKSKIGTDYFAYYIRNNKPAMGYYGRILERVSGDGDANDFEAFTTTRKQTADYIEMLSSQAGEGGLSDLDDDGIVNFEDFGILVGWWGNHRCREPEWCEGSDFNRSGDVDLRDLRIFAASWLWQGFGY